VELLGRKDYFDGRLNPAMPLLHRQSAAALGELGPEAKIAVPALIGALKNEDARVRQAAAEALGKIGPDAHKAVPSLHQALKDTDSAVSAAAAAALKKIDPQVSANEP
jgi:HEAT repeat protein